jgi:small subunit ribosomal protein S20
MGAITRPSDFAARHDPSNWNTLSTAQHKSAEKRARQTPKRTAVNRARRTKVRSAVKQVETAIASGDKAAAQAAFKLAQPALDKSVNKGVVHKGTASRKLSRLNAAIKTMG